MFTAHLQIENDIRLFYKVYSSTKENTAEINCKQPTLIFLHGGPGVVDHTLYEEYWSRFAGRPMMDSSLQVIFIDQRGCGRSYKENNGVKDYGNSKLWNLQQWGKDVHTFFTVFNIHKPIIAGVSFGGVVAMSCAVQFPGQLGGLILSDTDGRFDLNEVLDNFSQSVRSKGGNEDAVNYVRNIARKMFTETTPETYKEYVKVCLPYCAVNPYNPKSISQCVKNEESAFLYNRNELTKFNFLPDLHTIQCQTLMLAGDQSPVHSSSSATKTAAAFSQDKIHLMIYKGAGSPVYADREAEVTQLINDYLDSLSFQKN